MSYKLLIALFPGSTTDSIYELPLWKPSETTVFPYVKAALTVETDYKDCSSIENWYTYGDRTSRDYKFVRGQIQQLYTSIGWVSLTTKEKEICCELFIATKTERDELYTTEQQVDMGEKFHKKSVESRRKRTERATAELGNRLLKTEYEDVMDDISAGTNLFDKYVFFGREGTVEGDTEGIFDYLESRAGTSYATTGFIDKVFTPLGMADMTAFSSHIMDILKTGNYTI
jgi:hypothetical protein